MVARLISLSANRLAQHTESYVPPDSDATVVPNFAPLLGVAETVVQVDSAVLVKRRPG